MMLVERFLALLEMIKANLFIRFNNQFYKL